MALVEIASLTNGWVADEAGNGLAARTVVFSTGTVYTSSAGTTPLTPVVTDSRGIIPGYIAEGQYTYTAAGRTFTLHAMSAGAGSRLSSVETSVASLSLNIKDYGAIGDSASHPLSSYFGSLAAAQVVYPLATTLTQQIDEAAFYKALAAGAGSRMTLYFPDGTYVIHDVYKVQDDVTLRAHNALIQSNRVVADNVNAVWLVGNRIKVWGLNFGDLNPISTLDKPGGLGNGDLLRIGRVDHGFTDIAEVIGCEFGSATLGGGFTSGCNVNYASRVILHRNRVRATNGNGLGVSSCQQFCQITKNFVYDTGDDGIAVVTAVSDVPLGTTHVIIEGNEVELCDAKCIGTTGALYGSIKGNTLKNSWAFALGCFSDSFFGLGPSNYLIIEGNTIIDAGQNFGVAGRLHPTASTTPHGMHLVGNALRAYGNMIKNAKGRGVNCDNGRDILIALNYIEGCGQMAINAGNPSLAGKAITAVASTDIFTATAHGYSNGDPVTVTGLTGGAGLTAGTLYYIISATANTFQLSTTVGGSAVNMTTDLTAGTLNGFTLIRDISIVLNDFHETAGGVLVGSGYNVEVSLNKWRSYKNGIAGSYRGIQYGFLARSRFIDNRNINDDGADVPLFKVSGAFSPDLRISGNDWYSNTAQVDPDGIFRFLLGGTDGASVVVGTGSPEGVVTGNIGAHFLRTDGSGFTALYIKGSGTGNTGWTTVRDLVPVAQTDLWLPTNALVETVPRWACNGNNLVVTSGILRMSGGMVLRAGKTYSTITVMSGNTAMVTPSNQWFGLFRASDRALLAVTADDTTTAWATNSLKTLTLASPYTPTVDTPVYVGVLIGAATMPTMSGVSMLSGLQTPAPALGGMSTTGLTNPASAPNPAAAITGQHAPIYAYSS